jgi:hypothetical protein
MFVPNISVRIELYALVLFLKAKSNSVISREDELSDRIFTINI